MLPRSWKNDSMNGNTIRRSTIDGYPKWNLLAERRYLQTKKDVRHRPTSFLTNKDVE